ncbi:MAG: hypothetical protein OXC26_24580 [Albidovulum sp.]|nr:hypothetical protein [Albidovulum sp.]
MLRRLPRFRPICIVAAALARRKAAAHFETLTDRIDPLVRRVHAGHRATGGNGAPRGRLTSEAADARAEIGTMAKSAALAKPGRP